MSDFVDINVDMGESYGRWSLGDDLGIMPYISSASVACGFHAGDPLTIRKTVQAGIQHGLQIGAHVALPDLLGFGRRRMAVSPEELKEYVIYQIGALHAFVKVEGGELGHVKPHGALYVMCSDDPSLASAVAEAMAELTPGLPLLLLNDNTRSAVEAKGIQLVTEAFVDLDYDADGKLILERHKLARDPEETAKRVLRVIREGKIRTVAGTDITASNRTICLHGDAPNAVEIARTVKSRLEAEGIQIRPLREMLAASV